MEFLHAYRLILIIQCIERFVGSCCHLTLLSYLALILIILSLGGLNIEGENDSYDFGTGKQIFKDFYVIKIHRAN